MLTSVISGQKQCLLMIQLNTVILTDLKMKKFNEDFIKDTATMFADMQSDDIKLNYKDGVYYGYTEGFKKALELVKNNGVLDDVSQQRELLKAFLEWQQNKYSMPYDTKIDWQIKDFEAFNCG